MKSTVSNLNRVPRGERGAVLVVGLIMLAVMTLFVISMLKTSIIELKIGGSSHVAAINFSNAEVAINNFIINNNGLFAPGFLATTAVRTVPVVDRGTVVVDPIQLGCGDPVGFGNQLGTGLRAVQFDVRATATGTLGGTTSMHQGVQSLAAPGSCP